MAVLTSRVGKLIAGKVGYGATCLLAAVALVLSGYAYKVVGLVNSTGNGIAINGSPTVGAMNILVMGLESRTDYQGNALSSQLLTAMHAGSRQAVINHQVGGQATNTLILIHIFAGGQKAVGFSIPRDDLVHFPKPYLGLTQGKIDQAYGDAWEQSLEATVTTSMGSSQRYLLANRAGQEAAIATVQSVTGVHVDHFVEVNLAGFYYLAQAFGGMEVCIKPAPAQGGLPAGANLTDKDPLTGTDNSGFDAIRYDGYNAKKGGAQYLHLSAAQSLAYVRSRDTLPGIDLGRTKRQQAVIDYVIYELKHRGVFSDLGLLNSLLGTASKYLITDSTFNLFDFATNMQALTGSHMSFTTLPISGQVNGMSLNGQLQDVNLINVPDIQRIVQNAFYPQPATGNSAAKASGTKKAATAPAPSTVTVDVYNGNSSATGLAGKFSRALAALGYKAGAVTNASAQSQTVKPATQVFYGAGASANAAKIATEIAASATALTSLPAGHVEVLIGSTVTQVPAGLTSAGTSTASTQSTGAKIMGAQASAASAAANSTTPSPSSTAGAAGGALTVAPNAPYGIPCVY
jgi:anionic cell wall polymer biosynthesis LytR-Cps2A-Psr (LCP) family protein